jgi:hypothetical protein
MKNSVLLILSAAVLVFGGCNKDTSPQTFSNVHIKSSSSPAAKFPAGSSYAFVQIAGDSVLEGEEAMVDKRIRTALADELKTKSYKPGSDSDTTFFVAYSLKVQQEIDVLAGIGGQPGNEWVAIILTPEDYVGGALFVQVIDAKKMTPVWAGIFNANIELAKVSEREKKKRVGYAVRELLKTFPPQ